MPSVQTSNVFNEEILQRQHPKSETLLLGIELHRSHNQPPALKEAEIFIIQSGQVGKPKLPIPPSFAGGSSVSTGFPSEINLETQFHGFLDPMISGPQKCQVENRSQETQPAFSAQTSALMREMLEI